MDNRVDLWIIPVEDPMTIKKNIIKKFPWFLFSWTIVLISVFVYADKSNYAYGCESGMFQWRLITYHMFHIDVEHLIVNILGFWLFGLYVNLVYNDFYNMLIYVIGVILSGLTYYVDCDVRKSNKMIIGASGGICAIVGAVFIIALWRFVKGIYELGDGYDIIERVNYSMLKYMLSFSTIFSVLGMVIYDIIIYLMEGDKKIAHIAHFSGYVSGVLVGILIITIKAHKLNG